jgi:hypothetical protein
MTPSATQSIITQSVRELTTTLAQSATILATSTFTPLPATRTPLPTLPLDEAQVMVFELLDTNAGCRLPCWWGITPGVTTLDEALHILTPFTRLLSIKGPFDQYYRATFRIPFPEEAGTINHTYYIKNNIVEKINVYNWNYATHTYLPEFLSTYGQPDEVWVRTYRPERGNEPFEIALFYPSQGILMDTPGGGGGGIEGNIIRNCLRDMNWPFLYLWSPEIEITFKEAEEKYLDPDAGYFLPLYDATGMTVAEFYENFKDPNTTACLETPLDLWP